MKLRLTIILLSLPFILKGQYTKKEVKSKAIEVANATVNSDWETISKYTYPRIIELMRGKENMIAVMTRTMQEQKIEFVSVEIGEPGDFYFAGENDIFSLVPQTTVLRMPNAKIRGEGYLLAISENGGQRWYFVDTAQLTMSNVKDIIPNYNMELMIPAKKQPVFLDD